MKKTIYIFLIGLIVASTLLISCSNDTSSKDLILQELPFCESDKSITTVRMFIPDYYAMAEQKSSRVIAPQTVSARLSYMIMNNEGVRWIGVDTVDLATAEKTPVEQAPDNFTGSVYTLSFKGLPIGSYAAGNLKIELLNATEEIITSGTNSFAISATKEKVDDIVFYTVPLSTGANTGNLAAGDMKFIRAALVAGVEYPIAITSSGDYPDLVLFSSDGKLSAYYVIDTECESSVTLSVNKTDVYYLGLWADDGNDIGRYTLAFDFGKGTQVSSVLTGDNLTWTKENSPYIVTGSLLVREGSELTIEPGVIVQFTGNYYLKVNGVINAVGTKSEPIIFVQSGDNLGTWGGVSIDSTASLNVTDKYTYVSGNILKNCMMIGASTPLTLNSSSYIDSCTFTGNSNYVNVRSNSILINNIMDSGIYVYNCSSKIVNNNIKEIVHIQYGNTFFNNNTISNASISFYSLYGSSQFMGNIINACLLSLYEPYTNVKFTGNNFIGYNDIIIDVSNNSFANRKSFNFTGNYWGEEQTAELNELGDDTNISFFNDFYDFFEWTEIDYSNWATSPIEGAGYLGDSFIAFDYKINDYNYDYYGYYPESTSPELTISIMPQYHANEITAIRIDQSLSSLKDKSWSVYNATQSFTVDKASLLNGNATIYVQLKDSEGNLSSPIMHEVPFDNPIVNLSIEDGANYTTATSSVKLEFGATDNCNLQQYELRLDNEVISSHEESYGESSGWGANYSSSYNIGLAYMPAGEHSITATFWDSARNSTTKTVKFIINRTINTELFESSFDSETGQLLKDLNTVYLWHFNGNGLEVSGNENVSISGFSGGTDGINGCAFYANISDSINVPLENAFTIECWRKGNTFELYKSDVFTFNSNYVYSYYKTASGSVSDNYLDWKTESDTNWHFYSFVYNGKYMAVYRDGVLLNYMDGLNQNLNTNDNKLYIYAYNIDELRISKIARSPDEIAAYYNAAKDKIQ